MVAGRSQCKLRRQGCRQRYTAQVVAAQIPFTLTVVSMRNVAATPAAATAGLGPITGTRDTERVDSIPRYAQRLVIARADRKLQRELARCGSPPNAQKRNP